MSRWDTPGVPHKGWDCDSVYDVREDGSAPDETEYETCQMCGNERIRYVHVMTHPEYLGELHVGCVCAEKMSGDYFGPRRREAELKNKAERKKRWLSRKWRTSMKGNDFLNIDGRNIVIFPGKSRRWGFGIDGVFSPKKFSTKDAAKLAAFEELCESEA